MFCNRTKEFGNNVLGRVWGDYTFKRAERVDSDTKIYHQKHSLREFCIKPEVVKTFDKPLGFQGNDQWVIMIAPRTSSQFRWNHRLTIMAQKHHSFNEIIDSGPYSLIVSLKSSTHYNGPTASQFRWNHLLTIMAPQLHSFDEIIDSL